MAKKQQDAATGETTKTDVDETVFGPLSEADLSALTDEERAATAPDEDEDEEAENGTAAETEETETEETEEAEAGETDEEAAAADGEGENAEAEEEEEDEGAAAEAGDEGAAETEVPDAAAAAAAAAAEIEAVDADADYLNDDGPAIPDYKAPDKAKDQLAAIEQAGKDIATKFDAGDLSAGEFHAKMAENSDAKGRLLSAIDKADWARDQRIAHFTKSTVPKFLKLHPEFKTNPTLYRALDGELKVLQTEAGKKGENYLDPKLLRNAFANVQKAFGHKETPAAQPGKNKTKPKLPDKSQRPDTPRTLARVPNDQIDAADDGKYARLDRLAKTNTTAYEEALGKMSPADRDDYLHYT